MKEFDRYIKEVKEQLTENCSEEYMNEHTTYTYTNSDIDENIEYFKDCMKAGLSPYKSLLFFWDNAKF